MRLIKKLTTLVLAGAMTLAMATSAFAAGITADEQKILDQAAAKAAELGVSTTDARYQKYYNLAESYLTDNETTATQIDAMSKAMDDATATAKKAMADAGVTSLTEMVGTDAFKTLKSAVATDIDADLKAANIKASVDANGNVTINKVPVQDNPIKQTGSDMTATVVVAVAVVGAIAACGVVAMKKELFGSEA